jgi:hypothetical protein
MRRELYDKSIKRWEEIVQNGHSDIMCGFCKAYHNSDNMLDEAEQAEDIRLGEKDSENQQCVTCPLYKCRACANCLEDESCGSLFWLWYETEDERKKAIYAQQMLDTIKGMEAELFGKEEA